MTEEYGGISLPIEEIEVLKKIEEIMGRTLPNIDNLTREDYVYDEETQQLKEITKHEFGFVVRDNHVFGLGLSLENVSQKALKIPKLIPKFSKFKYIREIDLNKWELIFADCYDIMRKKNEAFQSASNPMSTFMAGRTPQERQAARQEHYRQKMAEYNTLNPEISPYDVFKELKELEYLNYLDISEWSITEDYLNILGELKHLKTLILSKNNINKINQNLGKIENLEALLLNNNPIREYSTNIESLSGLKTLDLSETIIKVIPESFKNLNTIEHLSLPITLSEIPKALYDLKNLKQLVINDFSNEFQRLKSLISLYLQGARLSELPESIGELTFLSSLTVLRCTKLEKIPESIKNLHLLKRLSISGNNSLKSIPMALGELNSLEVLNLSNNKLELVPDIFSNLSQLEVLNLNNNSLKYLPYSIYKLTSLIDFSILNNPLEGNDLLISKKTLPEIIQYCKKKVSIQVFISHAVADFEPCNIEMLSKYLEDQLEVQKAVYCERDLVSNIDEFMDQYIPKSQLTLFIATPTSINSKDCQYELSLSKEYGVEIVPIKSVEVSWAELSKLDLNRALGLEVDFSNKEKFEEFCFSLYNYILQLKHQVDLIDKEKGKIDRIAIGLKSLERQFKILTNKIENVEKHLKEIENKQG
ncbi:MAG: hypothetical protein JW891_12240 [Candidatus Lokiarchaeota archaeon]|nr:hypothetical protein [Candidatus Lokiarchaeota archaeon]